MPGEVSRISLLRAAFCRTFLPGLSTAPLADAVMFFNLEVLDRYAAEAGCDRGGQLMQMGLATVGELATLPRQMRHGLQPTARSLLGSGELALGFANACGRLGAEPGVLDRFARRQRRKPFHAP